MSTICFDLERIDADRVAIRHVKFGTSDYNCHRALHFDGRLRGNKKSPWLSDGKFRYIWVIVATKDAEEGDDILFVCNDKIWTNRVRRDYAARGYGDLRILKIPFGRIVSKKGIFGRYDIDEENSLGDEFILNIPKGVYIF